MNILTEVVSFKDAEPWLLTLQGLYDLLPVVFFLLGSIILLRTLYKKMVKGCYCLLAAGSIMVTSAGILKAFHKIIMGLGQVDYIILDKQFTPTQSIGFLLLFLSLIGMFTVHNKEHIGETKASVIALPTLLLVAPLVYEEVQYGDSGLPAYTNSWPFLGVMIVGAAGFLTILMVIAIKMKRVPEAILFGLSIILMVGMGYLSTKRGLSGAWYQISCNLCYQLCFFIACLLLKKHGLEEAKLFSK